MSSIGSMVSIVASAPALTPEKFSGFMAWIDKIDGDGKSRIPVSPSPIGNMMNTINSMTSWRPGRNPGGKLKAGNLQDRLASQEG